MEYCFRFVRVRLNRPEEAETMLNELGSKGFRAVGLKEFSNDLIVVMEKELNPAKAAVASTPVVEKRGPGRPKKVIEEADA